MSVTSLLPLLLVASASAQNVNWATGSYSATYGQPQPQQAWQPQTFSLPEPVARPQRPVVRAPVSVGAGGYQHDSTGDDGYAYVHDTRGDFGPYKAFLARKKAQAAAKQVAPVQPAKPAVQQARPAVQQARPVVQKARPAVQKARPVVQQARPVVQQASSSTVSVSAGGYVHDPTGDDGQAYVHDTRGDRGPYYAFLARKKQQTGVALPAPVAPQPKQVVQVAAPVQQASPAFQQPAPAFQQAVPALEVGGPATHNPLRYAGHTNEFIDYVNRFGVRAYDYAAPTYSAQAEGNSFTYSATF